MWRVDRPQFDVGETFATCISRVRDEDLRQRFEDVADHIASRPTRPEGNCPRRLRRLAME